MNSITHRFRTIPLGLQFGYLTKIPYFKYKFRTNNFSTRQYKTESKPNYFLLIIPCTTFCLGVWQIQRRKWKLGLIDDLNVLTTAKPVPLPEDLADLTQEYLHVKVQGYFDHKNEQYILPRKNNFTMNYNSSGLISMSQNGGEKIGAYVITPFTLSNRDLTILVNRGWVPNSKLNPKQRSEGQIENEVEITGVIRKQEKNQTFTNFNNREDNIWYSRNISGISNALGTSPIWIDVDNACTVTGGPIGGQTRVDLRNEHLSYIITWFTLSAITSAMWYSRYIK